MDVVQVIVVGLIVALAFGYAAWMLLPRTLRMRAAMVAERWAARHERLPVSVRNRLQRLSQAAARGAGCGECARNGLRAPPDRASRGSADAPPGAR